MEYAVYIRELSKAGVLGDRSELVHIIATCESPDIISSITFSLPIQEAQVYHVGQELLIRVTSSK